MSLTVGELVGYMKLDDSDFNSGMDRAGSKWSKFSGGMKTAIVGAAAAAGVALGGMAAVIHTGFGEIMDASGVTAQLEAGIKSTGGVAGVTSAQMNALASSIQGYSGQTDDSIAAAESLLLTFTNIRNVGVDKIFDEATIATANMAAKMGGEASTYAIQLGKALNDPIAGISSLTRMGVQFTDAQKDQIKVMVESGDVMGAQKVILGELSTQFGGAAEAAGGALPGVLERLKRLWEDFSQSVMAGAVPALKNFGETILAHQPQIMGLAEVLGEKLGKVFEWLSSTIIPGLTKAFGDGATEQEGHGGRIQVVFQAVADSLGRMKDVWDLVWPAIKDLVKLVCDWLAGPEGQQLIDSVFQLIILGLGALQQVFDAVWPAIKTIVKTFIDFLNSDTGQKLISSLLGLVVVAVELVAEVFNKVWPALQPIVKTFCDFLGSKAVQDVLVVLMETVAKVVTAILTAFEKVWPALAPLVEKAAGIIGPILKAMMIPVNVLIAGIEKLKKLWDWVTGHNAAYEEGVAKSTAQLQEWREGTGTYSALSRASGGDIPGPLGAPIPLVGHGGEHMLNAEGTSVLKELRSMLQGGGGRGTITLSAVVNINGQGYAAGQAAADGFLDRCALANVRFG